MPPNSKDFIKKRGKIIAKEGGLGQNPQRKKNKTESKKTNNKNSPKTNYGSL